MDLKVVVFGCSVEERVEAGRPSKKRVQKKGPKPRARAWTESGSSEVLSRNLSDLGGDQLMFGLDEVICPPRASTFLYVTMTQKLLMTVLRL